MSEEKNTWRSKRVIAEAGLVASTLFVCALILAPSQSTSPPRPLTFTAPAIGPQANITKLCAQYDELANGERGDQHVRNARTNVIAAIRGEIGVLGDRAIPPCAAKFVLQE